jgi:putative transposase
VGENPRESLSELARLGARLIIQRAVEDEFDAWLGRARYERRGIAHEWEVATSGPAGYRPPARPPTCGPCADETHCVAT